MVRILVVEDDPTSREIIASLLASRGHEVETADDGFGALRMAQDMRYDLVFIDYHLPEMDGYALARLMRSLGERTNDALKMVAITADQFGLAARRGVDSIFDRVLAKPIQPAALFAFVDELLAAPAMLDELEAFLAPQPATEDESSVSLSLWRARGLPSLPKAAVFPRPSAGELESVGSCFDVVEPAAADCLMLLDPSGLAEVAAARMQHSCHLKPLIVIDPKLARDADAVFQVGNGESWTAAAETLQGFARRRAQLRHEMVDPSAPTMRFAAYMFVAERSFELLRGAAGQTVVPNSAGFSGADLIEAVKKLVAQGIVAAKLEADGNGTSRRLIVSLTAKGLAQMSSAPAPAAHSWAEGLSRNSPA